MSVTETQCAILSFFAMVSSTVTEGVWCSFSASTVLTNFSRVAISIRVKHSHPIQIYMSAA